MYILPTPGRLDNASARTREACPQFYLIWQMPSHTLNWNSMGSVNEILTLNGMKKIQFNRNKINSLICIKRKNESAVLQRGKTKSIIVLVKCQEAHSPTRSYARSASVSRETSFISFHSGRSNVWIVRSLGERKKKSIIRGDSSAYNRGVNHLHTFECSSHSFLLQKCRRWVAVWRCRLTAIIKKI